MKSDKRLLGLFIELHKVSNAELSFGVNDVRGVNTLKELMPTKANINGRDLSRFWVVNPGEFVFNRRTSRNGNKFSIAYNNENEPIICTEDYVVFRVKKEAKDILLAKWLYMFFNRAEFDRYVITRSWGGSTEFFNWEDLCAIELDLPPLSVQQKFVSIYNAMVENLKSCEKGLEGLKLVCAGYIEAIRKKIPCQKIGPYIAPVDDRNSDLSVKLAQGITTEKQFAAPRQVAEEEKYAKIVKKGQFAFNRSTARNQEKLSIAYRDGENCVVPAGYQVFEIKENDKLLPEYLMIWFNRPEFDRFARYRSTGSAHELFVFDDMCDVQIPIPDMNVQKAIADIYSVYIMRKRICAEMKAQIKSICPVLIKGSLADSC